MTHPTHREATTKTSPNTARDPTEGIKALIQVTNYVEVAREVRGAHFEVGAGARRRGTCVSILDGALSDPNGW